MKKKTEIVDNIIAAAIKEFGSKGYELASTNIIHKQAKVSKGTLFLYFNSKDELFYNCFVHAIDKLKIAFDKQDFENIKDTFDRMLEATIWKFEYFAKKPLETNLLLQAMTNPPPKIAEKILGYIGEISKLSLQSFFEDINMDEYSSEYTKEEVISYIQMALNGVQQTVYNTNAPITLEYLDSQRDHVMKFVKTLIRGMKK